MGTTSRGIHMVIADADAIAIPSTLQYEYLLLVKYHGRRPVLGHYFGVVKRQAPNQSWRSQRRQLFTWNRVPVMKNTLANHSLLYWLREHLLFTLIGGNNTCTMAESVSRNQGCSSIHSQLKMLSASSYKFLQLVFTVATKPSTTRSRNNNNHQILCFYDELDLRLEPLLLVYSSTRYY